MKEQELVAKIQHQEKGCRHLYPELHWCLMGIQTHISHELWPGSFLNLSVPARMLPAPHGSTATKMGLLFFIT